MTPDLAKVEAVMRETAAELILPRFRALGSGDIDEKSGPHDLVTVADREAEERLTPVLEAMVPGSKVIGEEAVSAGMVSPDLLHEDRDLWLVDPVDGTYNFVQGSERFGVMVAFLRGGKTEAAWILLPVDGRSAIAERGSGATFGGERLASKPAMPFSEARGDYSHSYVQEPVKSAFLKAVDGAGPYRQGRCSAYAYTDLARGELDYVLQYIMTPWDHAPGQLIVEESGGRFGFLPAGETYTPVPREPRPMLITAQAQVWESYAEVFRAALPL